MVTDRTRHPLIKILYQDYHRISEAPKDQQAPFSLEFVNRFLIKQARSSDEAERIEALKILVQLAPPQARPLFLACLEKPATFALGALGLSAIGDPAASEHLVKILEAPAPAGQPARKGPNSPASPNFKLDAAIELCESGKLEAVD